MSIVEYFLYLSFSSIYTIELEQVIICISRKVDGNNDGGFRLSKKYHQCGRL